MRKEIPARPEGWISAGSAGDFHIWRAGKNDYRITDGAHGDVVAHRDQFGTAHGLARRMNDARKAKVQHTTTPTIMPVIGAKG